ncbi:MAG TPA: glycosyltransferase [Chloroflexota bacterium]|nr:glycosyltransferase [Chloroflexota bacterium]
MDVSVVIPAYNEARRLPLTLDGWLAFFARQSYAAEVLVVDDGSRDATAAVVRAMAAAQPGLRLLQLGANQGKGAAVRAGMLAAAGARIFYADADLNVSPAHLVPFLALLDGGYDVVIGTRSTRQYSATERSVGRVLAGLLVQVVRRSVLLPVFRDTQCGFKGFRREAARAIFGACTIAGFAFDLEVLFLARKLGYRVAEVPVRVERREGSTYSPGRHLLPFVRDILRVRWHDLRGRYG